MKVRREMFGQIIRSPGDAQQSFETAVVKRLSDIENYLSVKDPSWKVLL